MDGTMNEQSVTGAIFMAQCLKEEGVEKTILFNLCGHGHFDMAAYADFLSGNMQDLDVDEGELARASEALAALPGIA